MANSFRLDSRDRKNLDKKIALMGQFADKEMDRIMRKSADDVVHRMRIDAPEKTRRLKFNIGYEHRGKNNLYIHSSAIDPKTGEDYAVVQDQGGPGNQPPATRYFSRNIGRFISTLTIRLREKLKQLNNK